MSFKPKKQQILDLLPDALVLTHGARNNGTRYLTFDDGPDPDHTPQLLDLLARHGIRASFFLVGQKIERHPELVERIVAEGHTLGNHSYSHWEFRNMSLSEQLTEIRLTDALLCKFDGRSQHAVRPPRGYIDAWLLLHCLRHRRSIVHWSYDSLDYQANGIDALIARLRDQPPMGGDIVLMHDDSDKAATALAVVLPEWLAAGYTFGALTLSAA